MNDSPLATFAILVALPVIAIAASIIFLFWERADSRACAHRFAVRAEEHRQAQVAAADALLTHGIDRTGIRLNVLADLAWNDENTRALLREVHEHRGMARAVLDGATKAADLSHNWSGPAAGSVDIDALTLWVRAAMRMVDAGTPHNALPLAVLNARTALGTNLPLAYAAWAYAAGMTREEATARYPDAKNDLEPVRAMARNRGMDLSVPHVRRERSGVWSTRFRTAHPGT